MIIPRISGRSLGILVLLTAVIAVRADDTVRRSDTVVPAPRKDAWWMKRHDSFVERAKKGGVDVLFLGDSITHDWEGRGKKVWEAQLEPLHAANFGIGGDRTQHVLWRITEGKELAGINPKVIVIMIGTNNMGGMGTLKEGRVGNTGNTAGEIADGIQAIVASLRKQRPAAKILLLGIFPRAEKANAEARAKIKEVNHRIAKLDDGGAHVKFLDIGDHFLDKDGTLTTEVMFDYLHFTPGGYQKWADAILPTLKELLGNK